MLVLPVTVRIPSAGEMPDRPDLEELLLKREKANIREGFTMRPNTTRQLPFSFYADININNPRLWDLLEALSKQLPEEVCCVYGLDATEQVMTEYFPKAVVWQKLTPYRLELTADCFIEFGLVHHSRNRLTEILVTASKYISYCGSDREAFFQCMKDFELPEIAGLAFIDEYPKIVEPLKLFVPAARQPEEVIRLLDRSFNVERE
ncbi:MAG TPA: hypothetical protein VIU45_09710 [Chitinophagaceae bacterium]